MNPYLQNLKRIEFIITFACTGRCKHCSEGDHTNTGIHIDGDVAADMVQKVAKNFNIDSLMTFGGEPLLYPDDVCKIHSAARDAKISKRQLITNGFFSRDDTQIKRVGSALVKNGVNDVLLSVDAFHQETIPLEPVITFAKAILASETSQIRVHPAWLVSEDNDNPYNLKTHEILKVFNEIGILPSGGNVIFPRGNALKYLGEYFDLSIQHRSPYDENAHNITSVNVNPDGDVLGSNIYKSNILDILANYTAV